MFTNTGPQLASVTVAGETANVEESHGPVRPGPVTVTVSEVLPSETETSTEVAPGAGDGIRRRMVSVRPDTVVSRELFPLATA